MTGKKVSPKVRVPKREAPQPSMDVKSGPTEAPLKESAKIAARRKPAVSKALPAREGELSKLVLGLADQNDRQGRYTRKLRTLLKDTEPAKKVTMPPALFALSRAAFYTAFPSENALETAYWGTLNVLCCLSLVFKASGVDRVLTYLKVWAAEAQFHATGAALVPRQDGIPSIQKVLMLGKSALSALRVRDAMATIAGLKRAIPATFVSEAQVRTAFSGYVTRLVSERPFLAEFAKEQGLIELRETMFPETRDPARPRRVEPTEERAQMLVELQRFAYRISYSAGAVEVPSVAPISDKACLERSRKSGGAREHLTSARTVDELVFNDMAKGHKIAHWSAFGAWAHASAPSDPRGGDGYERLGDRPASAAQRAAHIKDVIRHADSQLTTGDLSALILYCHKDGSAVPTRPLILKERGLKTRIASVFPAAHTAFSQRVNKPLLRILRRHPKFYFEGEGQEPGWAVSEPGAETAGPDEVCSADLTAASDFLEHDVLRAAFDGVFNAQTKLESEHGLQNTWTDELRHAVMILLGEHEIVDVEPKSVGFNTDSSMPARLKLLLEEKGTRTKRGAAMGLALAWPLLSMANAFATQWRITKRDQKRVRLLGDDMLGRWQPRSTLQYFQNLQLLGLEVNVTKSIRSLTGGVFAERYYYLSNANSSTRRDLGKSVSRRARAAPHPAPWQQLVHQHATSNAVNGVKIRSRPPREEAHLGADARACHGIVGGRLQLLSRCVLSALTLAKTKGDDDATPISVKLGDAIRQSVDRATCATRKAAIAAANVFWADTLSAMARRGLPLRWPQELGGWGIPGKMSASPRWRKAAAVWAALPQGDRPNFREMLRASPRSELDDAVDDAVNIVLTTLNPVHVVKRGTGGSVRSVRVEDSAGLSTSVLSSREDGEYDTTRPARPVPRLKAVYQVSARQFDRQWEPPSFEDVAHMDGEEVERRAEWVGAPAFLVRPILKTMLATRLRAGRNWSSAPEEDPALVANRVARDAALKALKGKEKRDPKRQAAVKEKYNPTRIRANRVVGEVNSLIRARPGVNPVAPKNATKLVSVHAKASTLYDFGALDRSLVTLGIGVISDQITSKYPEGPPARCSWTPGRAKVLGPDGEPLGWGDQSSTGYMVTIEPLSQSFTDHGVADAST